MSGETLTTEGDAHERPAAPPARAPSSSAVAEGSVLCLFDGSTEAITTLRFAAESAVAAGRRLIVAHVEKPSAGFWATAFTGYGACLCPPDRSFGSTAEAAFAAAVEGLLGIPVGWDFASSRAARLRALRRFAATHEVAVIVIDAKRRLARRLARDGALTVLNL